MTLYIRMQKNVLCNHSLTERTVTLCRCNVVHTYARESVVRVLSNHVLGAGGTGVSM